MKLRHQFKDKNIEREVNDSMPLGFFLSNKIGGMLFFDAKKDLTQYYARVNDSTLKVIHDINFESPVTALNHKFHSLAVSRKENTNELFVPHYMNALLLKLNERVPVEIVFDLKDIKQKRCMDHNVYEKQGRVVIRSTSGGSSLYTAIQGDRLFYESRKQGKMLCLNIMSPRIALAVSDNEDGAIIEANHLFENEHKIKGVQEKYISAAASFSSPEKSLAYACALNGMDCMLLFAKEENNAIIPVPVFSDVKGHHLCLAMHALLLEGEFGIAKKTLVDELENQHVRLQKGHGSFEEAAWPVMMFGKLLNHLCAAEKLYSYFSPKEIQAIAEKIAKLTVILECQDQTKLESIALLLSIYNLVHALTKMGDYFDAEQELKAKTRNLLLKEILPGLSEKILSTEDVASIFLTAYVYPVLLSKDEWKSCFDTVLEKMHNNFNTLNRKMLDNGQPSLDLELFGLASLASTVLSRTDSDHYKQQADALVKSTIADVLYKGIIGRPTSAFDHSIDPEREAIIRNTHVLNNALFLEMLRECAM